MTSSPPPSGSLSSLYGLLGIALLTVMDAVIKALSGPFTAVQILWLRFVLTALFALGLLVFWRQPWPSRGRLPYHALRAALTVASNGTFVYALGILPLAEVFALGLTAPVFLATFGALLLGERITLLTALGLALGFGGMLVIISGDAFAGTTSYPPMALIAALVSPVTYALNIVLLRQQAAIESPVQVVLMQAALVALFVTPLAALSVWKPGVETYWPMILAVGVTSTAGYLILVKSLAGLTAVRYSVIEYTGLIWAALIGWIWFGEWPTLALWLGAALIVTGALTTVLQRESAKS